jgi:protein-disulfide isomerase
MQMKKYTYSVLLLSITGAVISGILLIQHYFPEADLGILSCTPGADNPCAAVSMPEYSTLLGLPIASYGILSYLLYIFTVLIADYAEGKYYGRAIAILFPLTIISLMVDLVLILILIIINKFCFLCFITYIINSLLVITILLWYRGYVLNNNLEPSDIYTDFIDAGEHHDVRAAFSSYLLFIFFLAFAVFSTTSILKNRSGATYVKQSELQSFINKYTSTSAEKINFPETEMVIGDKNAALTIRIYSDFLCSACYNLYKTENYLLARFRGRIKIAFYNFPLERECNSNMENTLYWNSCLAAESMVAAGEKGIFDTYHRLHFENYYKYKNGYTAKNALENLDLLSNDKNRFSINKRDFHLTMKSAKTASLIKKHVRFAGDIKIQATPTIFINGKRLVGVPPRELLEAAILYELNRIK